MAPGKAIPSPEGAVLAVEVQFAGQDFIAINDRLQFKPNETRSLVNFAGCAKIDAINAGLIEGKGRFP